MSLAFLSGWHWIFRSILLIWPLLQQYFCWCIIVLQLDWARTKSEQHSVIWTEQTFSHQLSGPSGQGCEFSSASWICLSRQGPAPRRWCGWRQAHTHWLFPLTFKVESLAISTRSYWGQRHPLSESQAEEGTISGRGGRRRQHLKSEAWGSLRAAEVVGGFVWGWS
jgi:hypothetical protein